MKKIVDKIFKLKLGTYVTRQLPKQVSRHLSRLSQGILLCLLCLSSERAMAVPSQDEFKGGVSAISDATTLNDFEGIFIKPAEEGELQHLSQTLELSESMRGDFTQYRHLKVLKKPLISKGHFIFDNAMGLVWQQVTPFKNQLILSDKQLVQINGDGEVQVTDSSSATSNNAMAELMPTLVTALLGGDISTLSAHFKVFYRQQHTQTWQLGLTPIDPLLAKALARIVIQGDNQVQSLCLINADAPQSTPQTKIQHDFTCIEFTQLIAGALSEAEQAQFDPLATTTTLEKAQ